MAPGTSCKGGKERGLIPVEDILTSIKIIGGEIR
jgi:hypothetical protein